MAGLSDVMRTALMRRTKWRSLVALLVSVWVAAATVPAAAEADGPGSRLHWSLISRTHKGLPSGHVVETAMSADANIVVFQAWRPLLRDGGGSADPSLYAYDRSTDRLSMVSANKDGVSARGGQNGHPVVSPTGRWVAFTSHSPVLQAKGALGSLVVKDLRTGAVRRLEPTPQQSPPGATRPFSGSAWDWSADGKWLLAAGIWPGPGYNPSFWLVEWPSGRFHKLPIYGALFNVSELSANGDLVTGWEDRYPIGQVPFVLDVATRKRRVIPAPKGVGPTSASGFLGVYLSGDDKHVVTAWGVGDDIDRVVQVSRVRDLQAEQILTQENTGLTGLTSVSGVNWDGSSLLLLCMRRKPSPHQIPTDLYRYNRLTGGQTRLSVTSEGVPLNASVHDVHGNPDLSTILITTGANNLVENDTPQWQPVRSNDVFTLEIDPVRQ